MRCEYDRSERLCFNPLHCGAVVASDERTLVGALQKAIVSIPFIAGQWSLPRARQEAEAWAQKVSIPFIAGQWSLPAGRARLLH